MQYCQGEMVLAPSGLGLPSADVRKGQHFGDAWDPLGFHHLGMVHGFRDVNAHIKRGLALLDGSCLAAWHRVPSPTTGFPAPLRRENKARPTNSWLDQRHLGPASSDMRDRQLVPTRTPPSTAVALSLGQATSTSSGPRVGCRRESTRTTRGSQA
jgi:hypothetical protein